MLDTEVASVARRHTKEGQEATASSARIMRAQVVLELQILSDTPNLTASSTKISLIPTLAARTSRNFSSNRGGNRIPK